MNLSQLQTPALILDRPIMQSNIDRMATRAAELKVHLRPHAKTPKSIPVVRALLRRQAKGITVSTLKEAEYFAGDGIDDIFYAVALSPDKAARAARLISGGTRLTCLTDSLDGVKALAAATNGLGVRIPFLIEIDIDHYRSGVMLDDPQFVEIARILSGSETLGLSGVMAYGGASYQCTKDDAAALTERIRTELLRARDLLQGLGFPCDVVSFGSSPAVLHARTLEGITEARCGIYVFQDLFQAGIGACRKSDIALSVLCAVIGRQPNLNRLIVDAGGLALSKDRSTQGKSFDAGYGLVCDAADGRILDDLYVSAVSQELGLVTSVSGRTVDADRFPIGHKLRILPNHADMTAAAYGDYHVIEGSDIVVDVWQRVNGW